MLRGRRAKGDSLLLSLPGDVLSHVVLPFLTLLDGNCVRIVCRELRDAATEAPWRDEDARIPSAGVGAWHKCFPRAMAANLSAAPARDRHGRRRWVQPDEAPSRLCDADLASAAGCSVVNLVGQGGITGDGLAHLRAVRELKLGNTDFHWHEVRRQLTDADLRRVSPALKMLSLDSCGSITGDGSLAVFGQLEALVLRSTYIKPAAFYNLCSLTELTWMGSAAMPEAVLVALAACAPGRLRVLDAESITAAGLRVCTGLSTLRLRQTVADEIMFQRLFGFQPPLIAADFEHLGGKLRELISLGAGTVTDDIVLAIASSLETLSVHGDGVTAASLAHAKKLRSLTASGWSGGRNEIAAVAGSLRVLKLSNCRGIDDAALAPLAGGPIVELAVSDAAALTDAGLVAALAGTRVRILGVPSCCGLSGACFASLAELKELDVSSTGICDGALAPLAGRLRKLTFFDSRITDAAKSCLEPDA